MNLVPLISAVGLRIRCPDPGCGAPSLVQPSRAAAARPGSVPPPPGVAPDGGGPVAVAAARWCIVNCPRTGAKLFPGHQAVEVISDGG